MCVQKSVVQKTKFKHRIRYNYFIRSILMSFLCRTALNHSKLKLVSTKEFHPMCNFFLFIFLKIYWILRFIVLVGAVDSLWYDPTKIKIKYILVVPFENHSYLFCIGISKANKKKQFINCYRCKCNTIRPHCCNWYINLCTLHCKCMLRFFESY